ncbi:hypothetical protein BU23DRAFT_552831 [Bimuria novae-zelandiae CBS 107.79]|uniref:GST N-terminal domain-containing protein n=1 Tax=Bimuria novae-zelandiae CBS 107.79 TaxID=1447943 RepID=A0A6A5VBZ3_9PLEO|nr:hypothetical protein BU23DRAFT_552831 [Bimuria novae-zelandiae CBS 107.79]
MNSSQLPLHHLPPQALHLHQIPQGLQPLEELSPPASDPFFQHRYAQQLQAGNPHALHFQGHGLQQPSQPPFEGFPGGYARFELNTPNPPPPPQHQVHVQAPPPPPRAQVANRAQPPLQVHELKHRTPFVRPHEQPEVQEQGPEGGDEAPVTNHGQFEGLKLIPNPPDLDVWREKLFHVDDMITLTEDEFQTYFPHVDSIYSHRSTQRHKRKRFVSHYWDCRLKGRPPGTKKSTDPEKKKRKRVARERDLCDVKIKITEYFDGAELAEQTGLQPPADAPAAFDASNSDGQFFGQSNNGMQWAVPSSKSMRQAPGAMARNARPKKFYTIQRVNGNGGNGKGDGVAGPHKHSLEESDRVKKNSVHRWLMKNEREKKKAQGGDSTKKTYHKKATGNALVTVKSHAKDEDLKLYGSCFCPFVQRVWISLEHKILPYQYIEVDPYKKPQSLLEVNPRGLVPAIRHGPVWSMHESTVIMEYLEDLQTGPAILPPEPQTRATCRLWTDHINRHIVPTFYRLLQAQDPQDQVKHATELREEIGKLVDAADPTGPFFLGQDLGFVDVQIAPWVVRLKKVLGPYRGWPEPEEGSRWKTWVDAIETDPSVKATTSTDELYLDSYERYAENRPGTSQLANAVNSGRGLP